MFVYDQKLSLLVGINSQVKVCVDMRVVSKNILKEKESKN